MKAHINYTNTKRFTLLIADTENLVTNCTGIAIENIGEVTAYLKVSDETFPLRPGSALVHSNDPDVIEQTVYDRVTFDESQPGEKMILITKEFISPVTDDSE